MNELERNFFKNIKANKLEGVKAFLENNPKIRQVYDGENKSASMVSLKTLQAIEKKLYDVQNRDEDTEAFLDLRKKQLKIYELLAAHGFTFSPLEDNAAIENELDIRTRIKLRKIHKTLLDVSLPHLAALISISKLAHHTLDENRSAYNQIIARTFEELNAIKWIEPILKVAAHSDDLRIIFDFHNDSIMSVDTTAPEDAAGVANTDEKVVFIGAARLLIDQQRFEVLGHLAHEITHYAMQVLYENKSKPYSASSEDREKFELINKACEERKDFEKYISLVYHYGKDKIHSELIVRVPHLLALYSEEGKQEKLDEVKQKYSELFEFFETKTLVDLEREHPLIEARKKIAEINELAGVAGKLKSSNDFEPEALKFKFDPQKVSVVESNCPQLTMKMIHQQNTSKKDSEFSFIFITHETLMNDKLFAMAIKAFSSAMKPTLVIDCGAVRAKEFPKFTGTLSRKSLSERVVAVVGHKFDYVEESVVVFTLNHFWSDLKNEAQESYLKYKVVFQGLTMPLSDVLPIGSEALRAIPLGQLLDINMIKISDEVSQVLVDFYVDRFFRATSIDKQLDPRRFDQRIGRETNIFRAEEVMRDAERLKVILLSSDPGMGKSTELKMMAQRLKSKFPSRWVVFVDLKQFVEVFEKDGEVTTAFESSADVVELFCGKILQIGDFEAAVFSQLFHQNRVIFFLDGFDEISPSFKEFNINLAKAIKDKTENLLWISTRTHLEEELKAELDCIVYELRPLDPWRRCLWVKQKLQNKGLTSDQIEAKYETTEALYKELSGEKGSPILLRMALELSDEPSFQPVDVNLYLVYKTFAYKVVEDYVKKGAEAMKDVVDLFVTSTDIIAFHQRLAVKEILYEAEATLFEPLFENQVELSHEKMVRLGFVFYHNRVGWVSPRDYDKLHFVQRTFAEFFIVDLVAKSVRNVSSPAEEERRKSLIEIFRQVWLSDNRSLDLVRTFFEGLFEMWTLSNETIKLRIIKDFFEKNFTKSEIGLVFATSVKQGLYNSVQLIPLTNDSVLDAQDRKDLWLRKIEYSRNSLAVPAKNKIALMVAAEKHPVKFIALLVSLARTAFDDDTFEEIFYSDWQSDKDEDSSILQLALHNTNRGVLNYFLKLPELSVKNAKAKKLIMQFSEVDQDSVNRKKNLLIHVLDSEYDENKRRFLDLLVDEFSDDEIKSILGSKDDQGNNILHVISQKFTSVCSGFLKLLKETLSRDELRILTLAKNDDGLNAITTAVERIRNEEHFQIMWNFVKETINHEEAFKNLLQDETDGYKTILTFASANSNAEVYQFVLDVYKSLFDESRMRQMLSKIDYNRNNWHYAVRIHYGHNVNLESCGVLWKYMQEIFDHVTLSKFIANFRPEDEAAVTKISVEEAYNSTRLIPDEPDT